MTPHKSAPQPAEAALITEALKRHRVSGRRLTVREAADLAGISESRWRQIANGYRVTDGRQIPVRGPAEPLARMARVVGVTPEQLEEVGRQDAADELRLLAEGEPRPPGEQEAGDVLDPETIEAIHAVWRLRLPVEVREQAIRDLVDAGIRRAREREQQGEQDSATG